MQQMNIFDLMYDDFKITNKIRLLEFFSGIGSQAKSLHNIGANFEHHKTCEWAIPSILAYASIHRDELPDYGKDFCRDLSKEQLIKELLNYGVSINYKKPASEKQLARMNEKQLRLLFNSIQWSNDLVDVTRVKGKDLGIVDTETFTYLLTYSFPCQSLSAAGKRDGMAENSGTTSSMVWEIGRILRELKELNVDGQEHLPKVLLMENVPLVVKDAAWDKWCYFLEEELGYKCYVQVLNAVNYETPQNRERCFMVSILGDYNFHFPTPKELKINAKSMLEKNVDEKFYLSPKMKQYIVANNDKWGGNNYKSLVNKTIVSTINTGEGRRRCDASNYVCDELPDDFDLKMIVDNEYEEKRRN